MEIVMKTYVSPQEQKRDSNVSRMTTRVDKSVHDVVARAAKIGGLSISKYMEQAILKRNFTTICIVRPSILLGMRPEKRPMEEIGKVFIRIFSFMLIGPLKKYKGIQAETVARAMIRLANSVNTRVILESHKLQDTGNQL